MRAFILLAATAALPSALGTKCKPSVPDLKWPDNFSYGCGTSAYQIEGAWNQDGRGPSVWDEISHNTTAIANGDSGDIADDHYNRYESDVDFFADQLAVDTYSFSISWSRIQPTGRGAVNEAGIAFYANLIKALKKRNITPICKLYHWDIPQALEAEYGGWTSKKVVADFEKYASIVFDRLGPMCDTWITINEPGVFCNKVLKFSLGRNPTKEKLLCGHNALLAHAAAVKSFRSKNFVNKKISLILDGSIQLPFDKDSEEDQAAAIKAMDYYIGWFAHPVWIGDYPAVMKEELGSLLPAFTAEELKDVKGSADFFSFDAYTSQWATALLDPLSCDGSKTDSPAWPSCVNSTQTRIDPATGVVTPIGVPTQSTWNYLVPVGLRVGLNHIHDTYRPPFIVISENGMGVVDEAKMPFPAVLHDAARVQWYSETLKQLNLAITTDKVPVTMFLAWSCFDNFEWEDGYTTRFGIAYVDYQTQKRTAKDSAAFLKRAFRKV